MIRRKFFLKLSSFVGAALLTSKITLDSSLPPPNDDVADNVYEFSMLKPSPYRLSAEDEQRLKHLKKSFRASGRLLKFISSSESASSTNQTKLKNKYVFDSKPSRDEFVTAYEDIISRKYKKV